MRFGSLFRSCPDGHAPAGRAPSRIRLQRCSHFLLRSAPRRCSVRLVFPLSTRPFRLPPLRSKILSHLVLDHCAATALYFHTLTNPFSRNTFALIFLQKPRGVTPLFVNSSPVNRLPSARAALNRQLAPFISEISNLRSAISPGVAALSSFSHRTGVRASLTMMTAPVEKSRLPANQGRHQMARRKLRPLSGTGHSI